jgi:hypothetical protein
MMVENKNTVFEHWLAAYGTHLEELAGAKLSRSDEKRSQKMENPQSEREQ